MQYRRLGKTGLMVSEIGLGGDAPQSVVGNRQLGNAVTPGRKREDSAGEYQLNHQQERHDGHGRRGVPDDGGDKQRHHIRRIGNQKQRDSHIHDKVG